ncbi:Fic family protein [Aminipila luticellarii]|nr:Fic family protein [Aminipila luticellarii]
MYQQILEKKLILDSRKPYSTEVRKQIKEMGRCDLIYTSLHLDGSPIKKEQLQRILQGDVVPEVTLNDHVAIERYLDTLTLMENLMGMESDVSLKVIEELHGMSCGTDRTVWRKSNPILYTLDYNPPHWQEIREKMEQFIKWSYQAEEKLAGNILLKAAYLHHKMIEIYPFEQNSESTARLVLYYSLLRDGYPIFELRLSESEYNTSIIEYLKHKNIEPFYKAVERGIFNKLDVLLQMTEE